jgi:hypothetical protein
LPSLQILNLTNQRDNRFRSHILHPAALSALTTMEWVPPGCQILFDTPPRGRSTNW